MSTYQSYLKIPGVEQLLGISLLKKEMQIHIFNRSCRIFAGTNSYYFCFLDGYQETVFALSREDWKHLCPLAYDFREFLRLILACGSASRVASIAFCLRERNEVAVCPSCAELSEKFEKIVEELALVPVTDPVSYLKTVSQVIDISAMIPEESIL